MSSELREPKETENPITFTKSLQLGMKKGSLIDFETTGRPGVDKEHEVVTLGYMEGNTVIIKQRTIEDKGQFYHEIRGTLWELPRPYHAYNAGFERGIMEAELGISTGPQDFVDIMEPWKAWAESLGFKWPSLDELISEPYTYFNGQRISGKDVPGLWKTYLSSRDGKIPKAISDHCLSDISREAILYIAYQGAIGPEGFQLPPSGSPFEPFRAPLLSLPELRSRRRTS